MMESNRQRLNFVSFAYALGAILVVFGHSYPLGEAYTTIPKFLYRTQVFIYIFHMPLFFFISGLLLKYSHPQVGGFQESSGAFLRKKATKLLIPYFALALIAIVPKYFVSQYISDTVTLDVGYIIRTFLIPRDNTWGHFWFIPVLFCFFCLRTVWIEAAKRTWTAVVFTGFLMVLNFFPIPIAWFAVKDISIYGVFFGWGIYSAVHLLPGNQCGFPCLEVL